MTYSKDNVLNMWSLIHSVIHSDRTVTDSFAATI